MKFIKESFKDILHEILKAEMNVHLCYSKGEKSLANADNTRNGYSSETVRSELGPIELNIPRDREGQCNPKKVHNPSAKFSRGFKGVYTAPNEETALERLYEVKDKWGKQYPYAFRSWVNSWDVIKSIFQIS